MIQLLELELVLMMEIECLDLSYVTWYENLNIWQFDLKTEKFEHLVWKLKRNWKLVTKRSALAADFKSLLIRLTCNRAQLRLIKCWYKITTTETKKKKIEFDQDVCFANPSEHLDGLYVAFMIHVGLPWADSCLTDAIRSVYNGASLICGSWIGAGYEPRIYK